MTTVTCIIVEDELPAIELLKRYLSEFPNWSIEGVFKDPFLASDYLSKNQVDVLFLDIQLPKINGIDFLKSIQNKPLVIITSAYPEHAIEAFELIVFDYLLKPFSLARFFQTINRIHELDIKKEESQSIVVRESRRNVKLEISKILYFESQREYVNITCTDRTIKTKMSTGMLMEMLDSDNFVRIHRSFVVSLAHIDSYSKNYVEIKSKQLPIGRHFKNEAMKKMASTG